MTAPKRKKIRSGGERVVNVKKVFPGKDKGSDQSQAMGKTRKSFLGCGS